VEPPRALLPGRGTAPQRSLTLAAVAAALALLLSSSGDALLVAVILGLAAGEVAVAGTAVFVALAALARWGTTSLSALAGIQAVVGPAGMHGSALAIASSWLGATALLVAAAGLRRRWPAVVLGLFAGLLVAGPSAVQSGDALVRVVGAIAGAGLAAAAATWVPTRRTAGAAALLAAAALAVGVAA
jgi:hypothetical protein